MTDKIEVTPETGYVSYGCQSSTTFSPGSRYEHDKVFIIFQSSYEDGQIKVYTQVAEKTSGPIVLDLDQQADLAVRLLKNLEKHDAL